MYKRTYPALCMPHLEKDLSAPVVPGVTGRHPLPDVGDVSGLFSNWGVDESVQVVVYDQGPGMIAARLWWMLRWLGHENAAVMDGGWSKWQKEGKPVAREAAAPVRRQFNPNVHSEFVANVEDVVADIGGSTIKLLDARAADRYRGENETLDPVAGHIPGAISVPFMNNLNSNGCLRKKRELQDLYNGVLESAKTNDAIVYCGSGITAALNILAMLHAGLAMARLYPGSWSHWITDKNRPITNS